MDIVFIHGNYPAQFRHLASSLGQSQQHRVFFLTAREDAEQQPIAGVNIRKYKLHRSANPGTHHYLSATEEAVIKGQAVLRALNDLIQEGLQPRLVITHAGMGLGLFVKDLLPKAVHIGLFEWFFRPETARWLFPTFELNEQLQTRMRNLPILDELSCCDVGVVPTKWQKKQFPVEYRSKLHVIFDGIDREFFNENNEIDQQEILLNGEELERPIIIKPEMHVLSYATRGMETLRGFPEFLSAAIQALQTVPDLQVVVAGRDRRAYSYDAPSHSGSWKNHLLNQYGNFNGKERLHFTGLMTYKSYRTLLQRSNLHCYFTRPYVTSWSLFEAASCGARLCVNHSPATLGVVKDERNIEWVNLDNQTELNGKIINALQKNGGVPRSSIKQEFCLNESLQQWQNLANQCLSQSS